MSAEEKSTSGPLPDYRNPPVIEVALAVGFEPIEGLGTVQLGQLWVERFGVEFPRVEEQPPLQPAAVERFPPVPQPPGLRVELLGGPQSSRLWFLNAEGTQLVQVQRNWFALNWREPGTPTPYPRFPTIRDAFAANFDRFRAFVEEHKLGEVTPSTAEVTYVNHITQAGAWSDHGDLAKVIRLTTQPAMKFLPRMEASRLHVQYVIRGDDGAPRGRLYASADPAFRTETKEPMFVLTLTARGLVTGGTADLMNFLEVGHQWVVRGFGDLTTDAMQDTWGRLT
jgi:hypothetical protein